MEISRMDAIIHKIVSTFLLLLVLVHGQAPRRDSAQYPTHDGVRRMQMLKRSNFNTFISKHSVSVVLFTLPIAEGDKIGERNWKMNEHMLEMTAQILEKKSIGVGIVNMMQSMDVVTKEGVNASGVVHVYTNGRKITYLGHRVVDILVSFLLKLEEKPVSIISSKSGKKSFDTAEPPKVIAYFEKQDSAGYREYEEAAHSFQPYIKFYAVFDKKVAGKLKLKSSGSIHFYKLFEKKPLVTPQTNTKAEQISEFIERNKVPIIKKLTLEDIMQSWTESADGHVILSFVNSKSSGGKSFIKFLKNIAQYYNEQKPGVLNFVYIEPKDFTVMLEFWEKTFKIDTKKDCNMGLVNVTTNKGIWFDMEQIQGVHSEKAKQNIMQNWLNDIATGKISLNEDKTSGKDTIHSNKDRTSSTRPDDSEGKVHKETKTQKQNDKKKSVIEKKTQSKNEL